MCRVYVRHLDRHFLHGWGANEDGKCTLRPASADMAVRQNKTSFCVNDKSCAGKWPSNGVVEAADSRHLQLHDGGLHSLDYLLPTIITAMPGIRHRKQCTGVGG